MCKETICKDDPPSKSPRYYLQWGSLRFGFHGIWAILTFIVTTICIVSGNDFYLWPSMIGSQVLAMQAYSLLDQVPRSTEICPGFVAPHQEAFKRTIAMMNYTNLQLAQPWVPSVLYYALLALSWWQFVPFHSDFRNGNTWIFVVPIFFGVSLDMTQSLVMDHCGLSSLVSWRGLLGVTLGRPFSWRSYLWWNAGSSFRLPGRNYALWGRFHKAHDWLVIDIATMH
jgi:hypothetical protein